MADRIGKLTVIATILFAVPLLAAATVFALFLRNEAMRPDLSPVRENSLCVGTSIAESPELYDSGLYGKRPKTRGWFGNACRDAATAFTQPTRITNVVLRDLPYTDWYLFAEGTATVQAYVPDASIWPFTDPDSIGYFLVHQDGRIHSASMPDNNLKEHSPGKYWALADLQRTLNERILLLAGGTVILIALVAMGTRLALRRAFGPAAAPVPPPGMGSTVNGLSQASSDLVLLARLDTQSPDSFDLAVLAHQETARRYPPNLSYVVDLGDDPVPVRGERELIGRLLTDLLDNAEQRASTRVTLRLRTTPQFAILEAIVDDSAPGSRHYSPEEQPVRQ